MAIQYIDPDLGERTLIVFSEKAHQEELARLKKLGYEITHPKTDSFTASEARFSDSCYPVKLVDFINDTLTREDLDAPAQWFAICEAEHLYYGGDEPFTGLPYQLSLETAPREQLLTLIRAKRTRGYESLMDRFGVIY